MMEPLLLLVHRIPFPPNKGDKVRSFHLLEFLASRYRVHLGTFSEIPPTPVVDIETNLPKQYAYEVLIFDLERDRTLVAAVELVSPANKDRPGHRQLFVAKCANLLQKGVCILIVDLVTIRQFNLYAELLALLGQRDPTLGDDPPPTYAATCRTRSVGGKSRLETWSFPLAVGQSLPNLPVWLANDAAVPLDLEASYEEACRVLKIR